MSTNYLIATTTRFKAAVSGASISNILAGYGLTNTSAITNTSLGRPGYPEVWQKVSYPFLHADKIRRRPYFCVAKAITTFRS
jgi:hypothetical protein